MSWPARWEWEPQVSRSLEICQLQCMVEACGAQTRLVGVSSVCVLEKWPPDWRLPPLLLGSPAARCWPNPFSRSCSALAPPRPAKQRVPTAPALSACPTGSPALSTNSQPISRVPRRAGRRPQVPHRLRSDVRRLLPSLSPMPPRAATSSATRGLAAPAAAMRAACFMRPDSDQPDKLVDLSGRNIRSCRMHSAIANL